MNRTTMSKTPQLLKYERPNSEGDPNHWTGLGEIELRQAPDEKLFFDVEVFVQPNFSQLELSSVVSVLEIANEVQNRTHIALHIISDVPGLVANGNLLVRAEPAIGEHYLKHCMIVIGGGNCTSRAWMGRIRAMQRLKRPVVLFSDAATEFIRALTSVNVPVTTHWRDIDVLNEIGDFPTLSTKLVEYSNGIFTCAGKGHAAELVFTLLYDLLSPQERAEMASLLIIDGVRGFHRDQPIGIGHNNIFLEERLRKALQIMGDRIEDPLPIGHLAEEVDISIRQLERLFKIQLGTSPAKAYKVIRLKRARTLITETRLSIIEISLACGFSSTSSMSSAYRQVFGMTPKDARNATDN